MIRSVRKPFIGRPINCEPYRKVLPAKQNPPANNQLPFMNANSYNPATDMSYQTFWIMQEPLYNQDTQIVKSVESIIL